MKREIGLDLWIRGEHPKPFDTIIHHREFMKREKVVESLAPIHRHVVHSGLHFFGENKEESLFVAKLRWSVSSNEFKNREPFGFRNFQVATLILERYAKMIIDEGPSSIGCKYSPPIIWYHREVYQSVYEIHKRREVATFEYLKGKHGFQRPREYTSPPFSITTLPLNSLVA